VTVASKAFCAISAEKGWSCVKKDRSAIAERLLERRKDMGPEENGIVRYREMLHFGSLHHGCGLVDIGSQVLNFMAGVEGARLLGRKSRPKIKA
jgi:hypothetical protein